jgi:streptogramin lyase
VRAIEIVRKSGTVKSCSHVPGEIFQLKINPYYLRAAGIFLLAAALAGCETAGSDLGLKGRVTAGDEPVSGSSVTLYAAGTIIAETLGGDTTDSEGKFSIRFRRPAESGIIYAVARGGTPRGNTSPNDAITFLTVIGEVDGRPDTVTLNELTTVASVWTNARFLKGTAIVGNGTGIYNAASNVGNLVNVETGGPGPVIENTVNGTRTGALASVNTLGNIVHSCAVLSTADACAVLFSAAAPPGRDAPANTLAALHNIALNPSGNVTEIFSLNSGNEPYSPVLDTPPSAWTIALKYTGGGLDSPGTIAIDADGNVWVTNGLMTGAEDCPAEGTGVTKLTPDGYPLSPAYGFTGGGIDGAGSGITIDQTGNVWIGNKGGGSVSLLTPEGSPISPEGTGYKANGNASRVEGTIADYDGNIWLVNNKRSDECPGCGNSLILFPGGDPDNAVTFVYPGTDTLDEPYGIALDLEGELWITNSAGNTVTSIDPLGNPVFQSAAGSGGISEPRGLAVDSIGNVWIANHSANEGSAGGSVTLLDPYGENAPGSPFREGLKGPWGIAVDGDDNVWVADFTGGALVNLCGARADNCPQGLTTGDIISPAGGYDGGGVLRHVTSIAIDQAGNVWAANNVNDPDACAGMSETGCRQASTECGGDGVVVFFGLAAPVDAPLIGPPRQP